MMAEEGFTSQREILAEGHKMYKAIKAAGGADWDRLVRRGTVGTWQPEPDAALSDRRVRPHREEQQVPQLALRQVHLRIFAGLQMRLWRCNWWELQLLTSTREPWSWL